MKFIEFNKHIVRVELNEFDGTDKKKTVILDDGEKYMLKFPGSIVKNGVISYINNTISEYIGCRIFASVGTDVQDTISGTFIDSNGKEKIVCACKDLRAGNEKFYGMEKLCLEFSGRNAPVTFDSVKDLLEKIGGRMPGTNTQLFYREYCRRFVTDALIGNTDRGNDNWGILVNEDTNAVRLAPVYDCGSSLFPMLSDDELSGNESRDVTSALCDENGRKIRYGEYMLSHDNAELDEAIKEIVPMTDLRKISEIINEIPYITDKRKIFYNSLLGYRYEKILLPALENALKR